MALDEATARFMAEMAAAGGKPIHEMTPEEARGLGAMLCEMYGPGPELPRVEERQITGADGGSLTARVFWPGDAPRAVLLYLHGGGWVIGDLDEFDHLSRALAQRTGAAVVLPEYRLAPEHRYPAAAEDAWAALRWVDEHIEEIAGARVPLIVAGDSSGGNLAAIVAQRARAEGGPEISLQVLVYPVTDADVDNASYVDPENQLLLSRDTMIWFWDLYVPDHADRANVDASPLRADDLSGLPPAVVLTAEHDVLRDEGEAYAEKLRAAGVPVEHRRDKGQMHGFFTLCNVLPGQAEGLTFVTDRIEQHLAGRSTATA